MTLSFKIGSPFIHVSTIVGRDFGYLERETKVFLKEGRFFNYEKGYYSHSALKQLLDQR